LLNLDNPRCDWTPSRKVGCKLAYIDSSFALGVMAPENAPNMIRVYAVRDIDAGMIRKRKQIAVDNQIFERASQRIFGFLLAHKSLWLSPDLC